MKKLVSMLFLWCVAARYSCLLLAMNVAPVQSKLLFDSAQHCVAGLLDPIWSDDATWICSRGYRTDAAAMEKNGMKISGYCLWDVLHNVGSSVSKDKYVTPKKIFMTQHGYELLVDFQSYGISLHRGGSAELLLPSVSLPYNSMPHFFSHNLRMFVAVNDAVTTVMRIDPEACAHTKISGISVAYAQPGLFTQWDTDSNRVVLHCGSKIGVFGISGAQDNLVCLCELDPNQHLYSREPLNFDHVRLSGDGKWIAVSKKSIGIRMYPVDNMSHSRLIDDVRDIRCVALNHDASIMVSGDLGGHYRAWDFNTANKVWKRYQLPIEVTEYDVHAYIAQDVLRIIRMIPVKDNPRAFHLQVFSCSL